MSRPSIVVLCFWLGVLGTVDAYLMAPNYWPLVAFLSVVAIAGAIWIDGK